MHGQNKSETLLHHFKENYISVHTHVLAIHVTIQQSDRLHEWL